MIEAQDGLLAGRVAVVTGGTKGIGRAIASTFEAQGAIVVVLARTRVPGVGDLIECDVSDEVQVDTAIESVVAQHGSLDVLVNNAGSSPGGMIHRTELADFRSAVDLNLQGTWLCTRAALRAMRQQPVGGSIVNISSIAAKAGNLGQAAYASSKAGVEALTRTTAREGARHGVRANVIRPGLIATDMTADMPEDWWQNKLATIPLGRAGLPDEVAQAALFLASEMSSYVTGAVIDVAGGREM